MMVRLWRTGVDPQQAEAYNRFAAEQSLPMFQQQPGFRGVFFTHTNHDFVVITLWANQASVDSLQTSPTYQATVQAIMAAGFLTGEQSVEVFEVDSAFTL